MFRFPTTTTEDDLKFDFAAPPGWTYAPGDTIIGNIVRSSEIVNTNATLTLEFSGLAKIEIDVLRGEHTSRHVESVPLVTNRIQTLHNGPIHLPPESQEKLSWEFSVEIPTAPDPADPSFYQRSCSVPFDDRYLPGTFVSTGDSTQHHGSRSSISYELKATLEYRFGKSHKIHEKTRPIEIRFPFHPTDHIYRTKQLQRGTSFETPRLLPGMQDSHITLKQRTLQFFGSSKIPHLWLNVAILMPLAIRIGSDLIPLKLNLEVDETRTTDELRKAPQTIQITSAKITLDSETSVAILFQRKDNCIVDSHTNSEHLHLPKAFESLDNPLVVKIGEKETSSIDFGSALQLSLRSDGLYSGGRRLGWKTGPFYPNFTSYCISRKHVLRFEATLKLAGHSTTERFSNAIEIFAE